MAISIQCPHCQATFRVSDSSWGKRLRCNKCEGVIPVGDNSCRRSADEESITVSDKKTSPTRPNDDLPPRSEERPARALARRRHDYDDDDRSLRRSEDNNLPLTLIIGGSVGGAVLLIVVVVLIVVFSSSGSPSNPVLPLAQNQVPGQVAPVQRPPQHPDPIVNNEKKNPMNPGLPPNPQPQPKPPQPPVWNVKPDPLPSPLPAIADPQLTVPFPGTAQLIFPRTPSPYVAVRLAAEGAQIWNLYTRQKTGEIRGNINLDQLMLSPDGKYLAGRVSALGKTEVEVRSAGDDTPIRRIVVDDRFALLQLVDFLGPEELLTVKNDVMTQRWTIWDIRTGKELRHFTDGQASFDGKSLAFSPGRRYVARAGNDGQIVLYDLRTTEVVGRLEAPPRKEFASWRCDGLAFAHDGSELAAVFAQPGKTHLRSWKIADGKVAADHEFSTSLEQSIKGFTGYVGSAVEWLSDRSGWLVYGHLLIDYTTGGVIFSVPTMRGDSLPTPRRMIGPHHLVQLVGNFQKRDLQIVSLPREQIAAARKNAQQEADPSTGKLPPPVAADWSGARDPGAFTGAVPWNAEVDGLASIKVPALRSIPLKVHGGDIAAIAFSAPAAEQVAIVSAVRRHPAAKKTFVSVDRYQLASGQFLGSLELFAVDALKEKTLLAQLSPDGSRLAVREPLSGKRLDIWSLQNGKHLVGWLPCKRDGDGQISAAAWLDNDHLLTQAAAGRLTLWQVPQCKALYSCGNQCPEVRLSPGRKYLVVFTGTSLELLETLSGKRCGQLAPPPGVVVSGVSNVAFSPDGTKLAAVSKGNPSTLIRWNLTTGQCQGSDQLHSSFVSNLCWCSPTHLLVDHQLFDVNLKVALCTYQLPGQGKLASGSPDGRLWGAFSAGPEAPALLTAQSVPEPQALKLAAQIAAGQSRQLFGPNMHVRLQVNGGDADFQQKVTEGLTATLRYSKVEVAPDANLTLTIQADERQTGDILKLESIGFPRKKWDVPVIEVTGRVTLTDNAGRTIWETTHRASTPKLVVLVNTDDPVRHFHHQVWGNVRSWAGTARPPLYIFDIDGQPRILPLPILLRGS